MRKILILFAHPLLHKSRVNRSLIDAVAGMDQVTVNNLYEHYPDFFIDVKREQALLLEHDVIIWHHPFYWYSAPALIKEWCDLVLEHGFAYGRQGNALKGKIAMNCITTGGRKNTYQEQGLNRFSLNQFLLPFNQSAHLCQMTYLPPFVVHGSHLLNEASIADYTARYKRVLQYIRDEEEIYTEDNMDRYMNDIIK